MARPSPDPQVVAPRQARSRATMERIVAATEELLAGKPFEQITIAEISARSGSAPTAIYARFSDKGALLLEVHDRFKQRVTGTIDTTFGSAERRDWPIDRFVATAVGELVDLYRANRHLLRSVLLADNPVMYSRAADLTRAVSEALARRVHPVPDAVERDLDFAVRAALALVQQELLFGDQPPARFPVGAGELTTRVTALILAAVPDR
ncbi:TetR/AcrR family transcriptional regulator [Actinoplanes sp. L3-i22]|uniref:TetR/AcrR family transcriptional regulator n=1 Tax=Actinoplanes sp. L3-i22 TaxID=2836373 RepID=UPI001C772CF5|nr:TetR/AcrR family transcriptional regulator [Actinoplanes sp. L3-i22]BCY11753.1 hypothetical protein L3i22_068410 [Actinoplanes sp. L3-i22]